RIYFYAKIKLKSRKAIKELPTKRFCAPLVTPKIKNLACEVG
ncbi:16642_t:CDS:1, partial [Dentiscutata erythropus]